MNKNIIPMAVIIIFLVVVIVILKIFDVDDVLLDAIKAHQTTLGLLVQEHYTLSVILYIVSYTIISLIPIPGDSALAVGGGFLFGTGAGFLYSLIAITTAGTILFLICRHIPHTKIANSKFMKHINAILQHHGINFLLALRLFPLFPIFITNVLLALTPVTLPRFIGTTVCGMSPIIFLYSFAGTKINQVTTFRHIVSIPLMLILIFLALILLSPILFSYLERTKK